MQNTDQSGRAKYAAKDGQRRRATILFADLVGSTPLAEHLGEEGAFEYVRSVVRGLVETVESHGGVTQEIMGDGIMALFGAPAAMENAPLAASRAALSLHQRVSQIGHDLEKTYGIAPQICVGLHTGSVVVGEIGLDGSGEVTAIGDAVNTAARLQGLADPGTTVVSKQMLKLIEGQADVTPLGLQELKGKSEPVPVFRLDRVRESSAKFSGAGTRKTTPLVGRSSELNALGEAWRLARENKVAGIAIDGEAGVGKSRLVHEFKKQMQDEGVFLLEGSCSPDRQGQPFAPLVDLVRKSFRITAEMDAEQVRNKLLRGLGHLGIESTRVEPYLMNLLGHRTDAQEFKSIDDEVVGSRTREAVLEMLRARCRYTPTVLVIEDIHWIDSATEGLVKRVLEAKDISDLLFVCTVRPGTLPSWLDTEKVRTLHLNGLLPNQIEEIVRSSLKTEDIPRDLSDLVRSKSEGNPLFAEEVLNFLVDAGHIEVRDGKVLFQKPSTEQDVPISVENLLMDRVDRLPGDARSFLEAAAVLGRSFDATLASQMVDGEGVVDQTVPDLVSLELITEERKSTYSFKHALLRDAVYNSLMAKRKEHLHARAAEIIERNSQLVDLTQKLAHHWGNSGRVDKAIPALFAAGEESLRIYSLDEANAFFSKAQDLVDKYPDEVDETQAVDLLLHLARIAYFQGFFSKIIVMVETHLPRVEALGDKLRLARFLFEGGYARVFYGQETEGKAWLERSLALAEEMDSDIARAYAYLGLSWFYVFWPPPDCDHWEMSRGNAKRAFEIGEREADMWVASKALLSLANGGSMKGRPKDAEHYAKRLLDYSRQKNDPRPRTMGLYAQALLGVTTADGESAIDNAEEAIQSALSPVDIGNATVFKSWGYGLLRDTKKCREIASLELAQRACTEFASIRLAKNVMDGALVAMEGQLGKGVALIKEGIHESKDHHNVPSQTVGMDLLGDVYFAILKRDPKPTISDFLANFWFLVATLPRAVSVTRKNFEDLQDLAVKMDAPAFHAKALLRLGQLSAHLGKSGQAHDYLSEAREIAVDAGATHTLREIDREFAGSGA